MNGVLRPGGTLTNTRQMKRLEGGARRMGTVGGAVYRTGKGNGGWGIKEFNCDSQLTSEFKVSLGYLRFCLKTTKQ